MMDSDIISRDKALKRLDGTEQKLRSQGNVAVADFLLEIYDLIESIKEQE